MPHKASRTSVMLAIGVLLAAAIVGGVIEFMSRQSLTDAARDAGYKSVGDTMQASTGYGVSQHLTAKAGTCPVLIYRRETSNGYWYTTYYDKDQLSSDDTLLDARQAIQAIARLAGTTCAL